MRLCNRLECFFAMDIDGDGGENGEGDRACPHFDAVVVFLVDDILNIV